MNTIFACIWQGSLCAVYSNRMAAEAKLINSPQMAGMWVLECIVQDEYVNRILRKGNVSEHPELQRGEVWITNVFPEHPGSDKIEIGWCGYATKRLGNVAYDIHSNPVRQGRPLFAQEAEVTANLAHWRRLGHKI